MGPTAPPPPALSTELAIVDDAEDAGARDARRAAERGAVERLRSGDVEALDLVYHWYGTPLYHLAYRLLGSRADAEDVVHDVFVRLPSAVRAYRDQGRLDAWLRTLVINRSLDRRRRASVRFEVPLDAARDIASGHPAPDAADEALARAVAALPETLRAVLVLRAVEGYSHAEIARTLGIRAGTSEVRYFRAIRSLRATLQRDR